MISIAKKITGYSIAEPGGTSPPSGGAHFTDEADRRIKIESVPTPTVNSLRWEKRPVIAGGNPAWTYMVAATNAPGSLAESRDITRKAMPGEGNVVIDNVAWSLFQACNHRAQAV